MDPLLPSFRRELRARAHHLHPVVTVGQHGLTPPVMHEIDIALTAHELIKVRIFSDERDERDALLGRICEALDCAAVQQIGKLLVLWRPRPATDAAKGVAKPAPAKARRSAPRAGPSPAAASRRRRAVGNDATPAGSALGSKKGRANAPPDEPARARKPGKAPPGVPRAAAPRRRRRAT